MKLEETRKREIEKQREKQEQILEQVRLLKSGL